MPPSMTIGLTGDVGAGKSTVAAWLGQRGASVCDADRLVHRLLAGHGPVVDAVTAAFGPAVRGDEGIDRAALARAAFADAQALRRLERIVHPAVIAEVEGWLRDQEGGIAVIEAVRLVESGMGARCDAVWLIIADREVRRARVAGRGWSPSEISRRMAAATPLGQRLAASDVVIDNSGPWQATVAQLARAWQGLALKAAVTRPTEELR